LPRTLSVWVDGGTGWLFVYQNCHFAEAAYCQ
jgi:hypothetical protein